MRDTRAWLGSATTSQATYNPSCVRYIGHPQGSYTFYKTVVDFLLSCQRGWGARTESGFELGGRGPWRVTKYAHLSGVNPKALLNVEQICTKEIYPPLFPRDDNNFSLYPREVRRRQ